MRRATPSARDGTPVYRNAYRDSTVRAVDGLIRHRYLQPGTGPRNRCANWKHGIDRSHKKRRLGTADRPSRLRRQNRGASVRAFRPPRLDSWCRLRSGGPDRQAGFGEAAVYEVTAVSEVAQAVPDALDEVFRGGRIAPRAASPLCLRGWPRGLSESVSEA